MNIAVVGTGYVGLVTGTCFAETGNNVICVDVDKNKIKKMKNGELPIYEPGLMNYFERNTKNGRLNFTTNLKHAVEKSSMIFLCLPTPQDGNGSADLSYILKVAQDLGNLFSENPSWDFKIVVDKSTVPVGTSEKVKTTINKTTPTFNFDVVSNPEFLREGLAVDDFMRPERIIIGTTNETSRKLLEQLYEPFVRSGNPIYFVDEKSAEMIKYAANSFLATKISFMNEIANLCELTGADVDKVRAGVGSDSRIGKRFLFPGVGYGGSCFPKDVKALINTANENKYDFKILNAVVNVNENQIDLFYKKILKHFNADIKGKTIAVWGLAFKPNTDDVREAPALKLIKKLLDNVVKITAYDPEAIGTTKAVLGDSIKYVSNQYDALKNADALVLMTEWNEFRNPNFETIKSMLNTPVVFDGRNVFDVLKMRELGFNYYSIGRPF
ncbi:MAG: UDP-glucose 6-dehydrogenase [Ignavibacteriales bacterium CG12_big_fil_rev_8_21_14_0_65_30_8]|nr:MAG: UDP-glucose 6-dehydrogenase [Ignavibacteriales bacterium CG12_big_fil_rev_8_21_14_0_65_30_8]